MPAVSKRHLVLVGMMGSGKSTVALLAGERLGRAAVDLDAEIERVAGSDVAGLFARDGEAGFRAVESTVLAEVLAAPEPVVLATGGGAVLCGRNRTLMATTGYVVWLRATPETLHARVGDDTGRPLLGDDPIGAFRRIHDERLARYRDVADRVVDVDDLDPEATADRVLAEVLT